jgi:hypothetical protein
LQTVECIGIKVPAITTVVPGDNSEIIGSRNFAKQIIVSGVYIRKMIEAFVGAYLLGICFAGLVFGPAKTSDKQYGYQYQRYNLQGYQCFFPFDLIVVSRIN